MKELPSGYTEWVTRVSDIVSFVFPFWWEDKERYLEWLKKNNIEEKEYLAKANEWWTYIHLCMEEYIKTEKFKRVTWFEEVLHWIIFIKNNLNITKLQPEVFVKDDQNRYQWTIDLVERTSATSVKLKDWKTYWIAKKFYWLPNPYKKPYDKLKKTALQLSLYAEVFRKQGITVEWISCVYLHESWAYEYELELYSSEQINEILLKYELSKLPKDYNITYLKDMKLNIRHPTIQYWYVDVELQLEQNEKRIEEQIKWAIKALDFTINEIKRNT